MTSRDRRGQREYREAVGADQDHSECGVVRAASEQSLRVTQVLTSLDTRQAELLLLRSDGLSYAEIASTLDLNPASVGTLIRRAQQAFRKEYVRKYGQP